MDGERDNILCMKHISKIYNQDSTLTATWDIQLHRDHIRWHMETTLNKKINYLKLVSLESFNIDFYIIKKLLIVPYIDTLRLFQAKLNHFFKMMTWRNIMDQVGLKSTANILPLKSIIQQASLVVKLLVFCIQIFQFGLTRH